MSLRELFSRIFPYFEQAPPAPPPYPAADPFPAGEFPALTRRELEVAGLIQAGLTNEQIASELGISISTVKTHVHHLLGKFQVRSRGELGELLGWWGEAEI